MHNKSLQVNVHRQQLTPTHNAGLSWGPRRGGISTLEVYSTARRRQPPAGTAGPLQHSGGSGVEDPSGLHHSPETSKTRGVKAVNTGRGKKHLAFPFIFSIRKCPCMNDYWLLKKNVQGLGKEREWLTQWGDQKIFLKSLFLVITKKIWGQHRSTRRDVNAPI